MSTFTSSRTTMPRASETSTRRCLRTPTREEVERSVESSRRSRSRTRRDENEHRSRSHVRTPEHEHRRDSARKLEAELDHQRARLRVLESQLSRERSMRQQSTRRSDVQHRATSGERSRVGDRSLPRERSPTPRSKRSDSPTFTSKDIMNFINSISNMKSQSQPQTMASPMSSASNINHKNILPDFDPSSKSQRIDIWLKKVNECATVYGWDERTIIHFAMQKLQGLAKTWYESLNSILFSWDEWQGKLLSAFPFEQNYGQSLEDMIRRKSKFSEPLEVYYYEKLALLNRCDIEGKRAVECIIHGLSDKTMKSSANALRCTQPDQLLQFLMSNKDPSQSLDRSNFKGQYASTSESLTNKSSFSRTSKVNNNNSHYELFCFNCKEKGHPYLKCPKPLIQCAKCRRVGHKTENCAINLGNNNKTDNVQKTMCILTSSPNSKFLKDCIINDIPVKSFVDLGSEVTLLTHSLAATLNLKYNSPPLPLRGFGNDIVHSSGGVDVELSVDGVRGRVRCQVVDDSFLDLPLLIGQSFTEQPHVIVYKNALELKFLNDNYEFEFPRLDFDDNKPVTIIVPFDVDIYGPALVKAHVDTVTNGDILVSGKVIGKPNQQFSINGGVYRVTNSLFYIYITPLSEFCQLRGGLTIGRATKIQIVRQILSTSMNAPVDETSTIDESQVKIGSTVNESQRRQLMSLLSKYKHCFASSLKELGCTTIAEMKIELNSKRPVVYRPYRLAHKERGQVREMIGEMLESGIIRESVSDFASPIILVRKKDGGQRLCVDYRLLNSITVKERYPMPIIEDEIARLSGQGYFITLDLFSGYYQVPISECSKSFTSFVTPDGQYEFNRMPFGLANAPAVFQRMMNRVLGSARFTEAMVYIDDVLIYGKSVEECLERFERVIQLIEKANLSLNLAKCEFLQDKINYLGYEISTAGVRPGDKKVQSVVDFPCPTNAHSVRQFLGLVGYFRKFIRNFASVAHPLNKLLRKGVEWVWSEDQDEAFRALKGTLVDRPILAIYDSAADTELHTDASRIGIGGILLQRTGTSDPFRPVAFYSRQTSPEEKNFHAFELETLAVVCSLKKFRVYLLGQNFKIVTDCSALRSTFSKRDMIPRIARWWLLLQEFQCTVEYRAGTKMAHVDALSRNPGNLIGDTDEFEQYPCVMQISSDDWLHTLQIGDSELRRTRDILTSDIDADSLKHIKENFLIKDNRLYKCLNGDKNNLRWVVPKGARWQLCRMNHDDIGHFGVEKTLERIKKTYWFPKMSRFIKKYVQACLECAYSKKTTVAEGHLHPITKVEVPFHTLHVDHLGPFVRSKSGNSYLLVIVDAFTKFVFVKPVRNTKTQTAVKVFEDIFCTFRIPDRVISDRGTCFTSHAFKRYCIDRGIRHILNAVASPRANGQVERYNRTVLNSLTAQNLNFDERNWDDKVGKVQWGMNNTRQKTTGRTPAEVMFGLKMNSEIRPMLNELVRESNEELDTELLRESVKDRIDTEQEKQKSAHDENRRPARVYGEGDLVKITRTSFANDGKSKKLIPPYVGPYRVIEVLGNDRYRLAAIPGLSSTKNKRKTTVAADRMLPWVHVAALDVNKDSDNDDASSFDDEEIDE